MPTLDETPETPSAGCVRRSWWARLLGAGVAAFIFTLSLSVVNAGPANALTEYAVGTAVVEGAIQAAPRVGWVAAAGGGGVLLATGGVLLGVGILAYATRDSWLPVVEGWLGSGANRSDPNQAGAWGTVSGSITGPDQVYLELENTSTNVYGSPSQALYGRNVVCQSANGAISSGLTDQWSVIFSDMSPGKSASGTFQPCGSAGLPPASGPFKFIAGDFTGASPANTLHLEAGADPATYTTTTTVTCKNPAGTTHTMTLSTTGRQDGLAIPGCRGWDPESKPIEVNATDSTGKTLVHVTEDPAKWSDWSDCFGPGGLACSVRVWINGEPCTVGGTAACQNWPDYAKVHPDAVQCMFGSHVVDMSECNLLKRAYQPGQGTQTVTKVNPGTGDVTTAPAPAPSTPGGPGTNPDPPPTPADPAQDQKSCMGDTYASFNPVQWVLQPVKCALKWAFVPSTPLSGRIDDIKAHFSGKAPFKWFSGIGSIATAVPDNGCPDWHVTIHYKGADTTGGDTHTKTENVVCDSSFTGAIRAARPFLTAGMCLMALWPMIRALMYAVFPLFKPVPGAR